MTKGSKIWLWILMIAGGFSAIAGLAAMKYSAGTGILAVIIGSCQIAGAALLLFKQKKEGFYLICVIAVVDFISSITAFIILSSKSYPPSLRSPAVPRTVIFSASNFKTVTSKVPPPRS